MRKIGKAQKMGITVAALCCVLLAMVFSADHKKLSVLVADALNALTGTEVETVNTRIVMESSDGVQTENYTAFGIYAPSAGSYTIGVTAENGKVRVNTGEAITVEEEELSVSLTEGANVLYFMDCTNPSIQWDSKTCELEPVNKVCMPLSGDANQDTSRTVEDLVRLKKHVQTVETNTVETKIADIDGDTSITTSDVSSLRTLLVGNPEYEVAERSALIVDAYIAETETLYVTLAEAVEAASATSVSDSQSVAVTVLNPTDVKLTAQVSVQDGAQIELEDDGTKDSESGEHNGWCRIITRGSEDSFKMFAVGNASLTLTGSSESDVNSSLILDGGEVANSGNHIVDVGNKFDVTTATFSMNAGAKITNNVNNGASSSGGAIIVRGTFNMNGGVISGNVAKGTGGAINLRNGSTMNMAGGIITENETEKETFSGGAVNVSGGATLNMTGGTISENIAPVSVDGNSVRLGSDDSVLKMEGAAYIDKVCIDASSTAPHITLTGKLTTEDEITLFYSQPLNLTNVVVERNSVYSDSDKLFKLSDRMLPCKLEQDENNENLCLKSDTTNMDSITASLIYSNHEFDDNTWTVQGVCSDGTYLYAAIEKNGNQGCKILRVDLGTWANPTVSELLPTDHSNEMTYNPVTGKIYITHCLSSGVFESTTTATGPYAISVVNPNNLDTVEEVIILPSDTAYTGTTGIYAMAYGIGQQHYVAGGNGFRFGFLDSNLTETAMPSTGMAGFTGYTGYIKQGVYANDTTIYTNTWNNKETINFMTMYDWAGNYNGTKYVVGQDGSAFTQESESMFEYNGEMYMACIPVGHNGVDIYKLEGVETATSTIDVKKTDGTIVEGVYTNLTDAITKANELGTATIVLKADVTVGETQYITGNVTITDDGTARTIRRQGFTAQMFVVENGAGLTFEATSEDNEKPSLTIDGNKATVGASNATVSLEGGSGALTINKGVWFVNAKMQQAGGIIRTATGSTATVTINGGVFANNEAETKSNRQGGIINVAGHADVNISEAVFCDNKITSTEGYVYGGVIHVAGAATLNISNSEFTGNKATTTAGAVNGGILRVSNGTVNIVGCTFDSNEASTASTGNGGVIQVAGGTLNIGKYENANGVITGNCSFTNNKFTGESNGGAIAVNGGVANVYNTEITGNQAKIAGGINVASSQTLTVGDSTITDNTTTAGSVRTDINLYGTIDFEGTVNAIVYANADNKIDIIDTLSEESCIEITGNISTGKLEVGEAVVTFANETIMNSCKSNGNLLLTSSAYALNYESLTTDGTTTYAAKLASAVAVVNEKQGYTSLADAIGAASALNSATIVLKADVTVGETQNITGNVTITDDGTARTITREEGFTDQMFVVADGASLTFEATGTDKTSPTLTIDGNGAVAGASGSMVSLGSGNGTLAVNGAVQFTNANISGAGGIISTEDGSTATVKINGGVFAENTANVTSNVNGGLINVLGTANVTISNALFQNNTITSTKVIRGGVIYVGGGTVNIVGSTFTSNTADTTNAAGVGGVLGVYGGTLNVGRYFVGDEAIEGTCSFTGNTFSGGSIRGGAIGVASGNAQVYKTTIQGNTGKTGGGVRVDNGAELTIEESTITENIIADDSVGKDIHTAGTVVFKGKVNTTVYCNADNKLQVSGLLTTGSEIIVAWNADNLLEDETVVTFESEEIMTDCQDNGYLVLQNSDYALTYKTITADDTTTFVATLTKAVAVVGDKGYLSLTEAITAANEEGTADTPATVILKADVTVNETKNITGNVTIKDDGTARTITREEGFADQMFVVADGASLTFEATGTDKTSSTLTIDGNRDVAGASQAMIFLATGNGKLTVNNAVQFTNANIGQTGGIISTSGTSSTAEITITGGVFNNNEANLEAACKGGIINAVGNTIVTISDTVFSDNKFTSTGDYVYGGVIHVTDSATLNISDSEFTANEAISSASSGGVQGAVIRTIKSGTVTVSGCTFSGNKATASANVVNGGIIRVGGGTMNIVGCTFDSNEASTTTTGNGGVIQVATGTLNIGTYKNENGESITGNCSFTNNSFTGSSNGGAIAVDGGSATIYNTTIQGNKAKFAGGVNVAASKTLTIGNSTITGNTTTAGSARTNLNVYGTVLFEGKVNAIVYTNAGEKLHINSKLDADSSIEIAWNATNLQENGTVVSFESEEIMNDCQTNGYLVLKNSAYALSYETTSDSSYIAKLNAVE